MRTYVEGINSVEVGYYPGNSAVDQHKCPSADNMQPQ